MAATVFGSDLDRRSHDEVSTTEATPISGASLTTLIFCTMLLALAAVLGGTVLALGLSALLVVGSALVSMGGDALTVRQAANLGAVHLVAFLLLSI